jgi:hypothetical protein
MFSLKKEEEEEEKEEKTTETLKVKCRMGRWNKSNERRRRGGTRVRASRGNGLSISLFEGHNLPLVPPLVFALSLGPQDIY